MLCMWWGGGVEDPTELEAVQRTFDALLETDLTGTAAAPASSSSTHTHLSTHTYTYAHVCPTAAAVALCQHLGRATVGTAEARLADKLAQVLTSRTAALNNDPAAVAAVVTELRTQARLASPRPTPPPPPHTHIHARAHTHTHSHRHPTTITTTKNNTCSLARVRV
jgi:hypothetical protein